MKTLKSIAVTAASAALVTASLAAAQGYKVVQKYDVGQGGGYDYMTFDSARHVIYITEYTRTVAFDTTKGEITGQIDGTKHAHGVLLDPDGVTGYLSDGELNKVFIVNLDTLKITGELKAGDNPDGMTLEPTTGHLWVFNGKSKEAIVFDLKTKEAIAHIPLDGKPEFPQSDGKGHVFVNVEDTSQLVEFDASNNTKIKTMKQLGCEGPTGSAVNRDTARLFTVCDNGTMPVYNTTTARQILRVPIGTGPDAVAYDKDRKMLYTSNGDSGDLSIIKEVSANRYVKVQTVKTAKLGRTVALDSTTGDVYVVYPTNGKKDGPLELAKISK